MSRPRTLTFICMDSNGQEFKSEDRATANNIAYWAGSTVIIREGYTGQDIDSFTPSDINTSEPFFNRWVNG